MLLKSSASATRLVEQEAVGEEVLGIFDAALRCYYVCICDRDAGQYSADYCQCTMTTGVVRVKHTDLTGDVDITCV